MYAKTLSLGLSLVYLLVGAGVPVYAAETPKATAAPVEATTTPSPGAWVKLHMAGSDKELVVLAPLAQMLQNMLDNAQPKTRNFKIQIDSEAVEAPSLLALSVQDLDVPEEDRVARMFYYQAGQPEQFQNDLRQYLEQSLGLGFPLVPAVPDIQQLLASQQQTSNVHISVESSEPAPLPVDLETTPVEPGASQP